MGNHEKWKAVDNLPILGLAAVAVGACVACLLIRRARRRRKEEVIGTIMIDLVRQAELQDPVL